MIRRNRALLHLALVGALLSGCGRERGETVAPTQPALLSPSPAPTTEPTMIPVGPEVPNLQAILEKYWVRSEHEDYDVISALIDPKAGGIVSGAPASWPDEYIFSVEIAPGSMDLSGVGLLATSSAEPPVDPIPAVEVQILVPRYHPELPASRQNVAVYRLRPHGMRFTTPATVTFCYPPWRNADRTYVKFHFWREDEDGLWVYYWSDYETLRPDAEGDPRTGLRFETTHFSRWAMQNGRGGDGIVDPDSLVALQDSLPVLMNPGAD